MLHNISRVVAVVVCLSLPAIASAAPAHGKRHAGRHWHGYGFLPGYRPPVQREQARDQGYWFGGPGFYRGRWNGGGFGPCWKSTPIGLSWICG
jgi:hypothetical protein